MIDLNNMKIGKRLALAFGTMTVMMIVGTILAIYSVNAMRDARTRCIAEAELMERVDHISGEVGNVYFNIWNVLAHDELDERKEHQALADESREHAESSLREIRAQTMDHAEVQQTIDRVLAAMKDAWELNVRVTALSTEGKTKEAWHLMSTEGDLKRDAIEKELVAMDDWQARQISESNASAARLVSTVRTVLIGGLGFGLVLAFVFSVYITRGITRPLSIGIGVLDDVSRGDLTEDVPEALLARRDEVGDLSRALQTMSAGLRNLIRDVSAGTQVLATSAGELSSVSDQMTGGARETSTKANAAANAAEEMSANAVSVAAGMEQATTSLATMAGSTEEMTSTIGEIA